MNSSMRETTHHHKYEHTCARASVLETSPEGSPAERHRVYTQRVFGLMERNTDLRPAENTLYCRYSLILNVLYCKTALLYAILMHSQESSYYTPMSRNA